MWRANTRGEEGVNKPFRNGRSSTLSVRGRLYVLLRHMGTIWWGAGMSGHCDGAIFWGRKSGGLGEDRRATVNYAGAGGLGMATWENPQHGGHTTILCHTHTWWCKHTHTSWHHTNLGFMNKMIAYHWKIEVRRFDIFSDHDLCLVLYSPGSACLKEQRLPTGKVHHFSYCYCTPDKLPALAWHIDSLQW